MGSLAGSGMIIRTEGRPAARATTDAAEGGVCRKVPKVRPICGKRGRYSLRRPGKQADTGKPLSHAGIKDEAASEDGSKP